MQYPKESLLCAEESSSVASCVAGVLADDKSARLLHLVAERHAALPRGSQDAKDLVADAVIAVISGEVTCDGAAVWIPLQRAVRRRAKAYRRAAEHSVLVALDDAPVDTWVGDPFEDSHSESGDLARDAAAIVQRIRELAAADGPVLRLLELRIQGSARRRDARSAGMTPKVYRGACERLALYARRASVTPLAGPSAACRAHAIEAVDDGCTRVSAKRAV